MNAEDLMIGDWVYDTILQGYTRVKVLTARGIQGDIHDNIWDEKTFEPIPLTPEILEKNGFRKLVTYGTEKWVCNNLRLNVYDSGETWRFCADTNRNENSVIYIRFIHELQHALRLCGIEKEITI